MSRPMTCSLDVLSVSTKLIIEQLRKLLDKDATSERHNALLSNDGHYEQLVSWSC